MALSLWLGYGTPSPATATQSGSTLSSCVASRKLVTMQDVVTFANCGWARQHFPDGHIRRGKVGRWLKHDQNVRLWGSITSVISKWHPRVGSNMRYYRAYRTSLTICF